MRWLHEIGDGKRRNANPEMVRVIRDYSDADMEAVADCMSRLVPRGSRAAGK